MLKRLMKRTVRRAAAVALVVCMAVTMTPSPVLAEKAEKSVGGGQKYVCGHVHDESCGYQAAVEGQPCGHEMEGGAYSCSPIVNDDGYEGDGDDDGNVGVTSPSNADKGKASPSNGTTQDKVNGFGSGGDTYVCDHTDGCGYVEAVEGRKCSHTCELCEAAEQSACEQVAALFQKLPGAGSITAETTEEELDAITAQLTETLAALDELSDEDYARFVEEHFDLMAAAMALNEAIIGCVPKTLENEYNVSTEEELLAAIASADGTESEPTVINISDTITVAQDEIRIGDKNVKLTGGGTLERGNGCTYVFISVGAFGSDKGSLTLENITLDGKGIRSGNALVSVSKGTLTMNRGAVLKNNINGGTNGGAVTIGQNGSFIMNDGEIKDNKAVMDGGGVGNQGNFVMKGGSITGNSASNAGGVYHSAGSFTVGGTAVIKNNKNYNNDTANNVYLFGSNEYITLGTGELSPADGMEIHVKAYSNTERVIVESGAAADQAAYFHADDPNFAVVYDAGALRLKKSVLVETEEELLAAIASASNAEETVIHVSGTIEISKNMRIDGQKIKLTGGKLVRAAEKKGTFIWVDGENPEGSSLTLEDITLDGTGTGVFMPLIQVNNGNLTMNSNVELTNNVVGNGNSGGAVLVSVNGNFTMNGGRILGNGATYGGGVFVSENGNFTMNGGSITGNHADKGGGVYNCSDSFTVGGDAEIKDNTKTDGTANNVQLNLESYLTLGAGEFAPKEGMDIHVQGEDGRVIVKDVTTEAAAAYFHPDDPSLVVVHDAVNSALMLKAKTEVVATIGDVGYMSLQAAFDAVKNGETIRVSTEITFDDSISTKEDGKNFTLSIGSATLEYSGSGSAIVHNGSGRLTIVGSDISGGTLDEGNATVISNEGTGTVVVQDAEVKTTTGTAIRNISTGEIIVVSSMGFGGVSATTGIAIKNESTGKITLNASADSQNTASGTIYISAVPTEGSDKIVLDIQGGTVSGSKYAVFFAYSSGVTEANSSNYYRKTDAAMVGAVYYEPYICVAKIGDKEYTSLQAAFDAVQNGQTIQLATDVEAADTINTGTIRKNVTLDLNSKTITYTGNGFLILHQNNGNLNIADNSGSNTGKLKATAQEGSVIKNAGNGGIIVSSGTISAEYSSAIVNDDNRPMTTVYVDGGVVNSKSPSGTIRNCGAGFIKMSGGQVSATDNGVAIRNESSNEMSVYVFGGTVSAFKNPAIWNDGSGGISISGDDTVVECMSPYADIGTIILASTSVLEIAGGTVRNTAASGPKYAVYFNDNSGVTLENLSQYYKKTGGTVEGKVYPEAVCVATIDGEGYMSLKDAFASVRAGESKTIRMEKDVTFSERIDTGTDKKDITLDLNGKIVEYNGENTAISHANAGALIIRDTGHGGKLAVTAEFAIAIFNSGTGSVTIDSGTVSALAGSTITSDGGTVKVTGGTVSATKDVGIAIDSMGTADVDISGGNVSAIGRFAIYQFGTGKIAISGEAVIESQNAKANEGTIYIGMVPETGNKLVLDIQGGTVRNTAESGPNYAVYFDDSRVTSENLSQYYRQSGSADVGKVYPESHFTYSIALDPGVDKDFKTAVKGYGEQTPHTVTVTNTGNQPTGELTAVLSGANPDSFTLSKSVIGSLEPNGSGSFTVKPNTGLAAGTYVANVTVSGGSDIFAAFQVSFTVKTSSNSGNSNGNSSGSGGGNSPSTSSSATVGTTPTELRKTTDASGKVTVMAVVSQETVAQELQNPELNKVSVNLVVPKSVENSQTETFTGITVEKETVEAVRQTGKWLEIIVKDDKGAIGAVWSLDGQAMKAAAGESTGLTLGVHVAPVQSGDATAVPVKPTVTAAGHENGLVLTVTANGAFLSGAKLTVPATGQTDIAAGTAVTLYQFDQNTGALRTVPGGAYIVDANGYVTIDLSAGMRTGAAETYVLLADSQQGQPVSDKGNGA